MSACPPIEPGEPLLFVVNGASGDRSAAEKSALIDAALETAGRRGDVLMCRPAELSRVAAEAAARAVATRTAVVAVGGDGTLNTVAQAAHAAGCAMGVVQQGTFNYFARTHGIPSDPADAIHMLLHSQPWPVQVAAINDRVFLVNASLGLYPDLLEDREAYKARFGRSRWVAFGAACATLLRAQRQLRLHIECGTAARDIRALTLFVGNNRLQLDQLGLGPQAQSADTSHDGRVTAVMLKPVGTLSMIRLLLHGAMGTLGEAQGVEHFEFNQLVVRPSLAPGRRGVKVACDGEVSLMRAPLDFRVLAQPLYLLMPDPSGAAVMAGGHSE